MPDAAELLEARITDLRTAVRRAVASGDRTTARRLRGELRATESAWDEAVLGDDAVLDPPAAIPAADPVSPVRQAESAAPGRLRTSTAPSAPRRPAPPPRAPSVPVREHVHRALTLLGAPSAPKLVLQVHAAFYSGDLVPARLTSLRRDEERSFRAAPLARPYYICAALTADLLAPARGVMALSTWPLHQRMVGPLSPRVDLLSAAIRLADHLHAQPDPTPEARRLIWRLANSIPGVTGTPDTIDAQAVKDAARHELAVHKEDDARHRDLAAHRAARQLDNPAQLFGVRLTVAGKRHEEVG